MAFENNEGKGENAGNQHFLLSLNLYYCTKDRMLHFSNIEIIYASNLVKTKILLCGKEF